MHPFLDRKKISLHLRKISFMVSFLAVFHCLAPAQAVWAGDQPSSLRTTLLQSVSGIYLTHIPGAFTISAIASQKGLLYRGEISDPKGYVHILSLQGPGNERVIKQKGKARISFLLSPFQKDQVDGFTFETKTGCFTLVVWQSPPKKLPIIHLNGYTPKITKTPLIFCGHNHSIRLEWQGRLPSAKGS
ncbi:MAG: hypothetical protein ACYCT9_08365 [Leptospirillum sp.]